MKFNTSKILNILLAICVLLLIIMYKPAGNKEEVEKKSKSMIETIHQRKSVRNFTDRKVTKSQLEKIVRAGMAAPTAVNKQPWAFVAITDREILDKLGSGLPYAKMLLKAPAAIVVCGNLEKALQGWGQQFWIQDCAAASQNILLAVESMGLGAVWTAAYPAKDRMETVTKVLNLPKHIVPLNVIPVGYPVGVEKPKDKWKPENLHWQVYND
jgi:nitroreductase